MAHHFPFSVPFIPAKAGIHAVLPPFPLLPNYDGLQTDPKAASGARSSQPMSA